MKTKIYKLFLGAAALTMICLIPSIANCQGILLPYRPVIWRQRPVPLPIQPFYVKNMKVNTIINDAVAETTVEQTFVNTAPIAQEGTYLFPLPEGATPSAFSMTVGDKTIEPKILTRDEAHSIYEGYVRRYKDPALLEYVGRSLVKISVYPIPPMGERVIRMRYTEILKPQGDVRKYAYPLSTSRFGAKPVGSIVVNIKLNTVSPIKNVYSPTHELSIRKSDEKTATASYEGKNDVSDRDLTLFYSTGADDIGMSLLTYKSGERDGYFMMLAAPRVTIPKDKILPKHIVFVLDRTGSMQGKKIEQARKSLPYCLDNLNQEDRFDVITFNEAPDILTQKLVPATRENIAKAKKFVENVEANGGTNIDDALRASLALFKDIDGKENMIVFITDGLPTVGETNINTILQHVKETNGDKVSEETSSGVKLAAANSRKDAKHVRLFCFGLGYDVNVPFLDRLSDLGRGETDFVKPEEDTEPRVTTFYNKVTSPILANVKLAFDGADVYDVYPKYLPDMFKGSQLVITGRFRGNGRGSVRLSGLTHGADKAFGLNAVFGEGDGTNTFLPRIWATRKLGFLIDQVRLSDNPAGNHEVIDEIVRLSKEYGIITEYTSFLVDDNQQIALGMNRERGVDGGVALNGRNGDLIRQEVARRAVQFGLSGEDVTDQSNRAKDLKSNSLPYSRYQSASGSVNGNVYAEGADNSILHSRAGKGNFGGAGFGGAASAPGYDKSAIDKGGFARGGSGRAPSKGKSSSSSSPRSKSEKESLDQTEVRVQVVSDRTFFKQAGNLWQDQSYDSKKQKVIKVQAFSDAHFALLKALPSLGVYSSVGEEVIVRIRSYAIQIGKTGEEKLTAAQVKEIVGK